MKVVFIIPIDKFTKGMYRFMEKHFSNLERFFIFYGKGERFEVNEKAQNCFWMESYNDIRKDSKEYALVQSADLILYSGLFDTVHCFRKFGMKTLKKTYIQFWGADFYILGDHSGSFKHKLSKWYRKYVIRHAAGVINLLPKEYEALCKICAPKGKHFIAPVCGDGSIQQLIANLRSTPKSRDPLRIIVGNSATDTNQHLDMFEKLAEYKNENIEIICPLSYGDSAYAETVIRTGRELFGDKFVPLTEFMDIETYYGYIARSAIAVFNNNRQQAMGNINAALGLGCKVYIRSDTAMWDSYCVTRGYKVYKAEEIGSVPFAEFADCADDPEENYRIYQEASSLDKYVRQWQQVFDSIEGAE
ncbi:MAG: TDP-N-acetylfucosamine:lipid II N-acetylfucosaminyltransferase [Oscillospiraceae bacterium]|nr:TDP-N-acetylfucosamine:lipid II N-acetylfucosaminyltransferase [Oscillospiraceae bacterium]